MAPSARPLMSIALTSTEPAASWHGCHSRRLNWTDSSFLEDRVRVPRVSALLNLRFATTLQRTISILVAVLWFLGNCKAQDPTIIHHPTRDPSTPQAVEGGMWRLDGNFDSTLHLKNMLVNQALEAQPSLVMADGTSVPLPPVKLQPAGVATVNIGDAVRHMPSDMAAHRSTYGMVSVSYSWSWGGAVLASVQNIDEIAMLSFHSNVQADKARLEATEKKPDSQRITAAWWRPYSSTEMFVFVGNSSDSPTEVNLLIRSESAVLLRKVPLTIAPHASVRVDAFQLLEKPIASGSVGSFTIEYTGPPRSLVAFGGLQDHSNGFSATLHLIEAHPEKARTKDAHQVIIAIPGILLGPQQTKMQFPQSTRFTPYLILHNTAPAARLVHLAAIYTANGVMNRISLGDISLRAGASTQADFKELLSKATIIPHEGAINVEETFAGNDGDLQSEAGSTDQSGNYVFEAEPQVEDWTISRTICYWTIAGDTNTMISLWNYTSAPEDLVLTLYYQGGSYRLPIHLVGGADLDLDIASLSKSGVPDIRGVRIPTNITEGSAILSSADSDWSRMFAASSTSTFNIRTGTCTPQCGTCNGVTQEALLPPPSPISLPVGSSVQLTGRLTYNTGWVRDVTNIANWSVTSSIGSINSSGLLFGSQPGSGYSGFGYNELIYEANYCSMQNFACPAGNLGASQPTAVNPTITQGQNLWFFGFSNPTPPNFTLGSVQTTFTASGVSSGTFSWTLSDGSKASFASGGTVQTSITTTTNTVTVYGAGFSTSLGDETLSLSVDTGGATLTASKSFTVDSPYKLSSAGATGPDAVGDCAPSYPPGNIGWHSRYNWQMLSRFSTALSGMSLNENFTNVQDYQANNLGFTPNGSPGISGVSTFHDDYCLANQIAARPPSKPPQSPLTTAPVDSATQFYNLGSNVVGEGVNVQTQTLTRYQDHATVTSVVSPVRN